MNTVPTPNSGPFQTTAQEFLSELDEATKQIISRINEWLGGLEGKTFEIEHCSNEIELIRKVVQRAGCELLFKDEPIQIRFIQDARARNMRIVLRGTGKAAQKVRYGTTHFPPLRIAPITRAEVDTPKAGEESTD